MPKKNDKESKSEAYLIQDIVTYTLSCKVRNVISLLVLISATVVSCYYRLDKINLEEFYTRQECSTQPTSIGLKYRAFGKNIESGFLRHVHAVLNRLGYQNSPNSTDWDLLWAHDYPFRILYSQIYNLKPHQRVNHFPGCGYITNKVDLSTSKLKHVPPAFKLPTQKQELLDYAAENPDKLFVQKSNDHRNIKIKKVKDVDLNSQDTFIQEYIDKPFLVDGYKFDIGVYTIITSMDPLRIYIYNGDVLFRYCPNKYYPFNPTDLDSYVVGDDYLPTWDVPSLRYLYNDLGLSMRDSFDAYVRSRGLNPTGMWNNIEEAIRSAILDKEESIVNVLQRFKSKRNFFEMMRFDFVVDENLQVYLMEANMSPNLSSAHYPPNQLLYEQVIFNLFGLVGLAPRLSKTSLATGDRLEELMLTADKNIMVFPEECSSSICLESCVSPICLLCKPCLSPGTKYSLVEAYREHVNRQDCKRIFPPTMRHDSVNASIDLEKYSSENQLQYRWFIGKCLMDKSWC